MALSGPIAVFANLLQFVGAFVSFSIAYVSLRGLRETESPTLLRLATAFVFLAFGFVVQGLVGLGTEAVIPGIAAFATTMLISGLLLETTGYFFLAFSHVMDVAMSKKMGLALMVFPIVTVSGVQVSDILRFLSFYFIMYGVVETLYSYGKTHRPDTLIIAAGMVLIALGGLVEWLSILESTLIALPLVQILMKEIGLLILFIPVLKFTFGRKEMWDDAI